MDGFSSELVQRVKPVRLLLLDVDGTLSDGRLYYSADWIESKAFDVTDGFGIHLLHSCGLKTGIITGRQSQIVTERAKELKIEIVYQGQHHKDEVFDEIKRNQNLSVAEIAYMGDDLFDLPLLYRVGFSAAPADAHPEVRKRVHFVTERGGGHGAVREVCELILKVQGHWDSILAQFIPRS